MRTSSATTQLYKLEHEASDTPDARSLPGIVGTALFVFSIYHYYRELIPVARHFAHAGWTVHAVIGWSGDTVEEARQECAKHGIEVHLVPQRINFGDHRVAAADTTQPAKTRPRGAIRRHLDHVPGVRVAKRLYPAIHHARKVASAKSFTGRMLQTISPDVVFGSQWMATGTFDNGFSYWCERRNILYCCLSFSAYLGEEQNVMGRVNHLRTGMAGPSIRTDYDWINRSMAKLASGWTRTHDGVSVFYWDPLIMAAASLHGLLEPNPWQRPTERYDFIYLFNEFSKDMALRSGIPEKKLVVAGIPALDEPVAAANDPAWRKRLLSSVGLSGDDDFILWNIEPGWEHKYRSQDQHWELVRAQRDRLVELGLPVVIALHPLSRPEHYAFLESDPAFRILREYRIHDIYPYCCAVLSHRCSTNLFAEVFGKQVVLFDPDRMMDRDDDARFYQLPFALRVCDVEQIVPKFREAMARTDALQRSRGEPMARASASARVLSHVCDRLLDERRR